MKSKLLLLLMIALGVGTISAQNATNLNELLSRLDENHMGSITEVFTSEELTTLRDHFGVQNADVNEQSLAGGKEIFAPENVGGNFGHFNTGTVDIYNILGPSGTADFDGAGVYNPFTGGFFVIDNAGNAYDINPVTGVYTPLGSITPPAGENVVGIEMDPMTLDFYAISTDGAGKSTLSLVNVGSLTLTPLGDTGLTLAIALAFDMAGIAYSYDIDNDTFYSIDKVTGVPTAIGPIGFDANFGQGMFLNPSTGNLYMTAFNNTSFQSELRMVNTGTGNTTFMGAIGSTTPGGTLQFAWSSLVDNTLGLEDAPFEDLSIYPNPSRGTLNIAAKNVIENIEIYNILGQLIMKVSVNDLQTRLNISHFQAGSYVAKINIDGQQGSYLFIKE